MTKQLGLRVVEVVGCGVAVVVVAVVRFGIWIRWDVFGQQEAAASYRASSSVEAAAVIGKD